jgi:hypothetical protein
MGMCRRQVKLALRKYSLCLFSSPNRNIYLSAFALLFTASSGPERDDGVPSNNGSRRRHSSGASGYVCLDDMTGNGGNHAGVPFRQSALALASFRSSSGLGSDIMQRQCFNQLLSNIFEPEF